MIQIAICDDMPTHCEIAKKNIETYFSDKNISFFIDTFYSGSELFSSNVIYDLLIMDIALEKENGMDVAKQYISGKRTRVILLSSHTEELPNGYKIGAFRFLTKPIQKTLLYEALDSVLKVLAREQWLPCFDKNKREYHIYSSEIFYIEAFHRKCSVHTENNSYDCYLGIHQIANLLCSPDFFRTHRSYIVNFRHIQCFGKQTLELTNGEWVPVSRPNVSDCLKKYQNYIRSDRYDY